MSRRRAIVFTLVSPLLCGVLVASLIVSAWLVLGLPVPAKGQVWLKVSAVNPGGAANFTSGEPNQAQFFLVLGTDSRDPNAVGLGDAIHVVGVNPAQKQATIIDIPRDTTFQGEKINANSSTGGLPKMVDAIQSFVGVPITYALTTNFDNFTQMVDAIGGIQVNVQQPMHDSYSGADFDPGPQTLNGPGALAFSRDRHSFADGDITRTQNQAYLMISALQMLQSRGTNPSSILDLLAQIGQHVEMQNTSLVDLFRLGRLVLGIPPANVKSVVIPVSSGAGTNLEPAPGTQSLFDDFKDDGILESH